MTRKSFTADEIITRRAIARELRELSIQLRRVSARVELLNSVEECSTCCTRHQTDWRAHKAFQNTRGAIGRLNKSAALLESEDGFDDEEND